jgi:hypothetical protein
MRWSILRPLLHKEVLRHLANRGGIALVVLLLLASMLLSFFGGSGPTPAGFIRLVQTCYLDYEEDSPLIEHLRRHVPAELAQQVVFRRLSEAPTNAEGRIAYPLNAGAIQLRRPRAEGSRGFVWFWYPAPNHNTVAPFEVWFWQETLRFSQTRSAGRAVPTGEFETDRSMLVGGLDPRSGLATSLVMFGLFFVCVYLLPSLTCEERERGVLLAQALSPASTNELLAARFLFYPAIGIVLAATLAGAYKPSVLLLPFFWLSLLTSVFASMGIGLTIASVARTQRAASVGAMGYLMGVTLILTICAQNSIPFLPWLAIEYHSPRLINAALNGSLEWIHWLNLAASALLAIGWAVLAAVLFRRRGWQ